MIFIIIVNGRPLRHYLNFFMWLIVDSLITLALANAIGTLLSIPIAMPVSWPGPTRSWNLALGISVLTVVYIIYKMLSPIYFRYLESKLFDSPSVVFPRTADEFRAYGVKTPLDFCWLAMVLETAPIRIGGLKLAVFPCNTVKSAKFFEEIFKEMFGRSPAANTWYQALEHECALMKHVDPKKVTDLLVMMSLSPSVFDRISPDFAFDVSFSDL